jgi:hypothetical protein
MADRSLPGILLIALVASSVAYLAFSGGGEEKISILEMRVPERMYYSDEEYHVVASMVARSEVSEVDLRYHWLRKVDRETLVESREVMGILEPGIDPLDAIGRVGMLEYPLEFSRDLGVDPTVLDLQADFDGMVYRVIFVSIGPAQELFLPGRIGPGEGVRPIVSGSYALMINSTGHLVNLFTGYPAFFYDLERTIISLEVGINRDKTIYQNRSPVSSLPRLRDLPPVGTIRLPLREDDRMDVVISIGGRGLMWWSPRLCVVEVRAEGDLLESWAYAT